MWLHRLRLITIWSILIPSKYLVVVLDETRAFRRRFSPFFFRLSPRGYSPGHPVFPFSQTNNSIWNTRTLSNGCLTSRFCFMGNKDLKLVNGNHEVLLGGWRGGLKVKICCQLGLQTLTLFKTKKNVHFACSPTLSRALIISRLTWLNAALDNRHNQINNVAFIWGL